MKTTTFLDPRAWLLAAALAFLASPAEATVGSFIRADFQNRIPTTYTAREPGLTFYSGHLVQRATDPSPIGGGIKLMESSFGQPFSPYIVRMNPAVPQQTYGDEVAAAVLAVLYPATGEPFTDLNANGVWAAGEPYIDANGNGSYDAPPTKAQVETGSTAFRYKYLLFSPNGSGTNQRTVADFDNIDAWYGPAERTKIQTEIAKLVDALAVNPLHTGLRTALLNAYTDRAIAEMQLNKKDLVALGKKRLALTLTGAFVIDEEITLLASIVARLKTVLEQYADLLARSVEGIEPRDFDTRYPAKTPFGYYIFATEQPARNTAAPQYFTTAGTLLYVPDYHPVSKEIPRAASAEAFTDSNGSGFFDAGEPFTDTNANGIYDAGSVLFSGFKDYTTLLEIMGEYVQRSAELARYRGMRRAPGDFALARDIITSLQKDTATDFALIRGMFAGVTFPTGDASGVNAAIGGVERAFGDSVNTRAFLQGRGNILGLDENFMVFLQDGTITDTYDLLKPLVYSPSNPASPVQAGIYEQGLARSAYGTYRAAVDTVVEELGTVKGTFNARFTDITGYLATEIDQFDGYHPKPGAACELRTLDRNIQSLANRQKTLGQQSDQFIKDLAAGNSAIAEAQGVGTTIRTSQDKYLNGTKDAYAALQVWKSASAASQSVMDGATAAASTESPWGKAAVVAATLINTGVQIDAARAIQKREQEIDTAAIKFQSDLAKVELPLTILQSKLELGGVKREQYANVLETEDNNNNIAQAIADRARLLREVEIIKEDRDENQASIRSRYYADPIHLVRSDNAIIKADAAFANAQRWMFYLLRALEYKWNQNFVGTYAGRNYDSGSIFKLRNAEELKDLYNALEDFNSTGRLGFSQNVDQFTVISLRNVLTPNPNKLNPVTSTDPGVRVDKVAGQVVTQREQFRLKLNRLKKPNGDLVIPLNTTRLSDIDSPTFFVGPLYNNDGTISREGRWHDVVRFLKVNIVYPSHVGTTPLAVSGQIKYSGLSLFRTRVAPNGLPAERLNNALDPNGRDIPGELITTPFRSYVQLNLAVPVFEIRDFKNETLNFARSRDYVANLPVVPGQEDPLPASYKFNAFAEYSVAVTGWELTLYNTPNVNLDLIEDIEFVVAHRSADREQAN